MKTLIGWDTQDITPTQPVELIGQYYQRISQSVRDPLSVTALAFEQVSVRGAEQAVMVSIDIVYVAQDFLDEIRNHVHAQVPDLAPAAIFIYATHVHTAPSWFVPFRWWQPAAGAMQPAGLPRTVDELTNFPAFKGRPFPAPPPGKKFVIDPVSHQIVVVAE